MTENTWKTTNDLGSNGCAYFGEGVKFKGSISVPEKIIVHGTVEGDVESRELLVGPTGTIKGDVRVDQADVQGTILERIEAKICLSLRKTGRIEGSASYGEIEIEKGGVLAGEVSSINKSDKRPAHLTEVGRPLGQHASPPLMPLGAARTGGAQPEVKKEVQDAAIKK
jgi:cytoskeletal protein CcmA (bactofilin family)